MSAKKIMIALASVILATGAIAAEHNHSHAHEAHGAPAKLTLDDGKKWETDAPLRAGMENIRETMAASLHEIHDNKLSPEKYATLASKVNVEVANIVANCKLNPKADAQLHLVIADIVTGAEAMEGKNRKLKRQGGAIKVLGALDKYGAYFEDPGWKPIKH